MRQLAVGIGLFLIVCGAVVVAARWGAGPTAVVEAAEPPDDPALTKLESCIRAAENAERAMDRANYGEARIHMNTLRERLGEAVFLVANQKLARANAEP